jgi:hypothetical protein
VSNKLTQEKLKAILHYEPLTGVFTNIIAGNGRVLGKNPAYLNSYGYLVIQINYKVYLASRLAFLYMTGSIPNIVDHSNCIRNDNRWSNLREATYQQNKHNSVIPKNNTTGVKGLRYIERYGLYEARVMYNGTRYVKSKAAAKGDSLVIGELTKWLKDKRSSLHQEYANHG